MPLRHPWLSCPIIRTDNGIHRSNSKRSGSGSTPPVDPHSLELNHADSFSLAFLRVALRMRKPALGVMRLECCLTLTPYLSP